MRWDLNHLMSFSNHVEWVPVLTGYLPTLPTYQLAIFYLSKITKGRGIGYPSDKYCKRLFCISTYRYQVGIMINEPTGQQPRIHIAYGNATPSPNLGIAPLTCFQVPPCLFPSPAHMKHTNDCRYLALLRKTVSRWGGLGAGGWHKDSKAEISIPNKTPLIDWFFNIQYSPVDVNLNPFYFLIITCMSMFIQYLLYINCKALYWPYHRLALEIEMRLIYTHTTCSCCLPPVSPWHAFLVPKALSPLTQTAET